MEAKLFENVRIGKIGAVKEFVDKGGVIKNVRDPVTGATLLHEAVQLGQDQVALELIVQGASISAKDKKGLTALHMAVRTGNEDLVKHLLASGSPLDVETDEEKKVELDYSNDPKILRILLKFGADVKDSKTHTRDFLRNLPSEDKEIYFLGDSTIKKKMDELGMK